MKTSVNEVIAALASQGIKAAELNTPEGQEMLRGKFYDEAKQAAAELRAEERAENVYIVMFRNWEIDDHDKDGTREYKLRAMCFYKLPHRLGAPLVAAEMARYATLAEITLNSERVFNHPKGE